MGPVIPRHRPEHAKWSRLNDSIFGCCVWLRRELTELCLRSRFSWSISPKLSLGRGELKDFSWFRVVRLGVGALS